MLKKQVWFLKVLDNNSSSNALTSSQIFNILTLRYDTSLTSNLTKLTWSDFLPSKNQPSLELIESLIKKSVEKKISQDTRKISIALSGGVDSTLVLSIIKKYFPDIEIEAFSVQFSNSIDETEQAQKIAEHFDINYNKIFIENYLRELPKAISLVESPFWDLHWYYVSQQAQKVSSYLVSGDGGDELFGGYTFRYEKYLNLTSSNSSPLDKVKNYLMCHERDFVPDQEKMFAENLQFSWNDIHSSLLPYFDNSLSSLDQVFLADYNGKLLYNFSPNNQKISNYFKLESLTPILEHELISYATHLPHTYKYDSKSNIGKLPLRNLLDKLNSSSLISNQKLGFSINTINLWTSYGYNVCKDFLLDAEISKEGWINSDWIKLHLTKELDDVKYINKFLGLLALEIWFRLFVTKSLKSNSLL
jgi:asparagine synthase (glutamine-hydrolysing)